MKKLVLALAVAAAALCACTKAEKPAYVSDEARVVKFSMGNFYSFNTRAAIAASTHVGIYASSPIGAYNKDYTVGSMPTAEPAAAGTLTGSSILWAVTQVGTTTPSKFFAMYPYASSDERNAFDATHPISYTIEATAESEEYAKDFLVDVVDQNPGLDEENPNTVSFTLHHPFAMLRYVITNTSDDAIRKVEIYGVHKTGSLAYNTAAITATGDALTALTLVEMPQESVAGNVLTYYSVIVPEDDINPTIKVTTWGGCTCTYQLSEAQDFVAGKTYTASITYDNTHSKNNSNRNFTATFNVTDWSAAANPTAGSQTGFDGNDNGWPYIKGENIDGVENWSGYVAMSCIGHNSFRKVITLKAGETVAALKIYKENSGSALWYGYSSNEALDGWQKIVTSTDGGAANIEVTAASAGGDVTIYYYMKDNSDPHEVWWKAGDVTRE